MLSTPGGAGTGEVLEVVVEPTGSVLVPGSSEPAVVVVELTGSVVVELEPVGVVAVVELQPVVVVLLLELVASVVVVVELELVVVVVVLVDAGGPVVTLASLEPALARAGNRPVAVRTIPATNATHPAVVRAAGAPPPASSRRLIAGLPT